MFESLLPLGLGRGAEKWNNPLIKLLELAR
jgi:hypothetical protein